MAKEAKPEAVAAAPAPPPPAKSKKLLIIIAALLVVILAVVAAGAFFFMRKHDAEADDEEEAVVVEPVKPKKKPPAKEPLPPVYAAMDAFTVNLAPDGGGEQFVQLILSVEVEDAPAGEQIKTYTPKIRNNVMMLLSSKKASELITREGKEKLASEIRDQMNKVLDPHSRPGDDFPVKEVLFTSFIIQ